MSASGRRPLLHLGQGLNAFGAQIFTNVLAVLKNAHALDVGLELAPRCPQRVAAVVAKLRRLAAELALRHDYVTSTVL